jgi:protein-S-isoprenylcysteine O-methyltransferase Ste14
MTQHTLRRIVSILGLAGALVIWIRTLDRAPIPLPTGPTVLIVVTLLPILPIFLGRWFLDRDPTAQRAAWASTFVHYAVAIPIGAAAILAFFAALEWPCSYEMRTDLPCLTTQTAVGSLLVAVTGLAGLLTVVNLAVRGLGAPFAIALTKRLATDRFYAWTRNPMVLASLAFLASLGLRLGSWWFIGWALLLVGPVMVLFLKVYEERELEIRFGEPYLAYRRRTPFLIPRVPRP